MRQKKSLNAELLGCGKRQFVLEAVAQLAADTGKRIIVGVGIALLADPTEEEPTDLLGE